MKSQFYSINGKKYKFKPLVLGQYRQLSELEIDVPDEMDKIDTLKFFMGKVPTSRILSIILSPIDYHMCEKNIDTLEKEIEFEITPSSIEEMVTDFFGLCPLEEITGDMLKMARTGVLLKRVI